MRVLGIETSCDETAVAVYERGAASRSHTLHSQVDLHAPYGGVVPELAARDHLRELPFLFEKVLGNRAAGARPPVDAVAYTAGPGLIGALLVGAAVGHSLAYAWEGAGARRTSPRGAPARAAARAGAAANSRFSPCSCRAATRCSPRSKGSALPDPRSEPSTTRRAKRSTRPRNCSGLGFPGGPAACGARRARAAGHFRFPRPLTERPGLDFSFSGLKTAVVVAIRDRTLDEQARADVARAFEEAVVDTLAIKCERAIKATGCPDARRRRGVGANQRLRTRIRALGDAGRNASRLSAPRVLYRQRSDDRAGGLSALAGRRAGTGSLCALVHAGRSRSSRHRSTPAHARPEERAGARCRDRPCCRASRTTLASADATAARADACGADLEWIRFS